MRQFYLIFPNSYALRSELSWTHYRLLMRVENENAREFYTQEAVKSQWSTKYWRLAGKKKLLVIGKKIKFCIEVMQNF